MLRIKRPTSMATAVSIAVVAALGIGVVLAAGAANPSAVPAAPAVQDAFGNLASTSGARTGSDELSANSASLLAASADQQVVGAVSVDRSVTLGITVSGDRMQVVPTSKNRLCTVLEGVALSCGDPLDATRPIVANVVDLPRGDALVYGVAMDGVSSVQVDTAAGSLAIPVRSNSFSARLAGDSTNAGELKVSALLNGASIRVN